MNKNEFEFDPRFWMFDLIQEGIRFEDMAAEEIALWLLKRHNAFSHFVLEQIKLSFGKNVTLDKFNFKCDPKPAHVNHFIVTWEIK